MKHLRTILLLLAVPAGILGYIVAVRVIAALSLPSGLEEPLSLTVPLFVAGLCMLPFIAPTFDRMARRDLEAHREGERENAGAARTSDVPDAADGPERTGPTDAARRP